MSVGSQPGEDPPGAEPVLPCSTVALDDALVLPTDGLNCSCMIFLTRIRLIRPRPKAQLTINIRRGWVKELSLSEFIRFDTWIALFTEEAKHQNELLTYISISLVPHTIFFRPLL